MNRRGTVVAVAWLTVVAILGGSPLAWAKGGPHRVTVTIASGPTSLSGGATNQTSASFTYSLSPSSATSTCSLDGAKAKACVSPLSYSGLKVGKHTVKINGSLTGYKSGSTTWTWTIDQTAPPAPTVSKPTSPNNLSSVSLTMSDPALDLGGYTCALDGASLGTCTSPFKPTVSTDGVHSVSVRAVDKAGNTSAPTVVSWLRDTHLDAPLVNSGPPSLTTSTSAAFTFSSDEQGVIFACKLDGSAWTACTSGASYSGLTSSVGGTAHSFQVRATDAAGNQALSSVYSWTVKNAVAIGLSWSSPGSLPAVDTNQTSGTFDFTTSGSPTVTCQVDGAAVPSCSSPVSASSLSDGTHKVTVTATGGVPVQNVTLSYSWTVDTVAPPAPTIVGPSGRVASTDASIDAVPGEGGDALACTIDAAAVACTSTVSLTGLSQGVHTFAVTATDAAGNSTPGSASWTVDTVGPVASVVPQPSLTTAATVSFGENAHGVSASSVALQLADATAVASSMTCRNGSNAVVSCSTGPVRSLALRPTRPLLPGQHYQVVVNPLADPSVVDDLGNVAGTVTQAFRGQLLQQNTSVAAHYTWHGVKTKNAACGSYVVEHRKGASVSYSFTGTRVAWATVRGRAFGWATLYIDGAKKLTVNNYATTTRYRVMHVVTGLSKTTHTVKVVVAGKKGARAATGTQVAVDGFVVGKKLMASPKLTPAWQRVSNSRASGRSYALADLKGQAANLTFRGTGVVWETVTGPAFGNAVVYVDGVKIKTVNNWSRTTRYQVKRTITGLSDGVHTVKVVVSGTKDKRSKGTALVIDSWQVS